jgi:acyl-CoA synthetase (AMP-forming)/AMP-acid ligase II
MPRFDARAVLRWIESEATVLTAVPQMFANMLKVLKEEHIEKPPHRLRYLYAGGSPLDLALKLEVERTFGLTLHNGYGQTEASPSIAGTRIEDPRADTAVGQPLPGVEIAIGNPNEQGIGEILVRGPNVMKGYFRNPEATLEALAEDGFLKTGDLGRQDGDGAIHIVGRKKELIIHSGFNVYPTEVEAVLAAHAAVTHCAVIGRARNGNEDVLAFVTACAPVSEDELRLWARERLAPYKVPARVIVAEALPQAATGKILKNSLLDHFRAQLEERD